MSQDEIFPVPDDWAHRAFADNDKYLAMYQQSIDDPNTFWREQGKRIDWFKPYTKVKNTTYGTTSQLNGMKMALSTPHTTAWIDT